jgi:hypothetical protein
MQASMPQTQDDIHLMEDSDDDDVEYSDSDEDEDQIKQDEDGIDMEEGDSQEEAIGAEGRQAALTQCSSCKSWD